MLIILGMIIGIVTGLFVYNYQIVKGIAETQRFVSPLSIQVAIASILIFYGFVFSPVNAWYFLLIIAIVIFTPIFFFLFNRITYKRKNNFYLRYYMNLLRGIIAIFYKSFIVLSILPKEAFLYTDAIVKALYRMFVSHKNLLNWITSEEAEKPLFL